MLHTFFYLCVAEFMKLDIENSKTNQCIFKSNYKIVQLYWNCITEMRNYINFL